KTPNHPQPVPPIFQPEVAARAVYWAAHHDRRELYVGFPTLKVVVGNKVAPWLAEWYLARTGFESQQMPELPLDPDRPVNLWRPLERDEGAHGRFDDRARPRSAQAWLDRQRGLVGSVAATGALTALGAIGQRLIRPAPSRRGRARATARRAWRRW